MTIRFALPSDFESILNIGETIFENTEKKARFNWPRDVLAQELKFVKTLIVTIDLQVVSFLCYRELPDILEISILATEMSFQKKRLQSALIKYLQQLAAEQKKYLILEVHEENAAAKGLYEKMGFVFLNSRNKYYSDGASASVMKWDNNKAGC